MSFKIKEKLSVLFNFSPKKRKYKKQRSLISTILFVLGGVIYSSPTVYLFILGDKGTEIINENSSIFAYLISSTVPIAFLTVFFIVILFEIIIYKKNLVSLYLKTLKFEKELILEFGSVQKAIDIYNRLESIDEELSDQNFYHIFNLCQEFPIACFGDELTT